MTNKIDDNSRHPGQNDQAVMPNLDVIKRELFCTQQVLWVKCKFSTIEMGEMTPFQVSLCLVQYPL